jgi:hypothetical protein
LAGMVRHLCNKERGAEADTYEQQVSYK